MKKILIAFTVLLFFVPALVYSDIITFRAGYFFPRAQSDLWEIEFENMDFTKTDFQSSIFSFTYEYFITNQVSFLLSVDGYTKQEVGLYRGFVGYTDADGDWAYPDDYAGEFIPAHNFSVSSTPIQASIKLSPLGRTSRIIPYIGGGAGIYIWSVRMRGDQIDFSDEWWDIVEEVSVYPIYTVDGREENRFSVGFHAFGGIMVPIANRISIEGEFKYHMVKGTFSGSGDFEGFESFDLSGYQVSIGLNYWF
jgi:hypothetical protein